MDPIAPCSTSVADSERARAVQYRASCREQRKHSFKYFPFFSLVFILIFSRIHHDVQDDFVSIFHI